MAIHITEMRHIVDKYDTFLIDLWGVIHDGEALYPDAINGLKLLKSKNKQVIFLSNGPRRMYKAKASLKNFGIEDDMYSGVMTSGEFLYSIIKNLYSENCKFFYIGPEEDADLFNGLSYFRTDNLSEASFILNCGLFDAKQGLTKEVLILEEAAKLKIPMLCPNPDIIVIRHSGEEFFCAGYVAQNYEEMHGEVVYFGKPYKGIYEETCKVYNFSKDKTIAIGDSLNTDIAGANNFGIDSILITGGIHSNQLKDKEIIELFNSYHQMSSYYLKRFK